MDPFSGDPHVTWAMYCIALAVVATVLLLAEAIAGRRCELDGGSGSKK